MDSAGLKFVAGIRLETVPRLTGLDENPTVQELVAAQSALWDGIQQQLADLTDGMYLSELRFSSNEREQRIRIDLLLWHYKGATGEQGFLSSLILSLLPKEYGWRPLAQAEIVSADFSGEQAYISRLVRRVEMIDLPLSDPAWIQSSAHDRLSDVELTAGLRQLPAGDMDPSEVPCVIPYLSPLVAGGQGMPGFLSDMLRLAPGVLSIVQFAVPGSLMRICRTMSSYWRGFLEPLMPSLPLGASEPNPLAQAYDRFSQPDSQFTLMTVRAAATDRAASIALARIAASRFGGMAVFEIRPANKLVPFSKLVDPFNEVPGETWTVETFEAATQSLEQKLEGKGIEGSYDPATMRTLLTLPYLYTTQEAATIRCLPISDENGMPGMQSKPVAPFSGITENPDPVTHRDEDRFIAPGENKLRLGIVRPTAAQTGHAGGSMASRYRGAHWHTMPLEKLNKHAFIVGSTGSGKTMTTLFLVRELLRLGKPFLVIEPVKTEYADALVPLQDYILKRTGKPLRRLRFEGKEDGTYHDDFPAFDPMRLPNGVTVSRHASNLKACFEAAFPLDPVAAMMLESGLQQYYTDTRGCGFKLFTVGSEKSCRISSERHEALHPSLRGFFNYFLDFYLLRLFGAKEGQSPSKAQYEFEQNFRQLFKRRFDSLLAGLIGAAARKADALFFSDGILDPLAPSLRENTILELDGVPDGDQKSLMMAFVLTYLFETRQAEDFQYRVRLARGEKCPPPEKLKHVAIIEEAHRLLSHAGSGGRGDLAGQSSKQKAVSLFVDMLAEIRALGQGLVIVEQIPTKIVGEAIKNTNLKVMLRTTAREDRDYLGEAMNFTEEQKMFVTSLRAEAGAGIDMVVFEEGIDQPLMLNLPLPEDHRPGWLYDELFPVPVGK